jgi:VPDSG-CTERM motif
MQLNMKSLPKTILAVLATAVLTCGLFCQHVQASQITGDITFVGSVNLNTKSASTATIVTDWHGLGAGGLPQVASHDGSFNGFVTDGDAVTIAFPWSFNSGAVPNFWSVDGFVFNLTSSSIIAQGAGAVTVNGTGTISGNGFNLTGGTWSFTTQNPSAHSKFSFSAATGGAVPDGGSSVALLGIALVGIEGMRRSLRAKIASR